MSKRFGICRVSLASIRAEDADRSEMTSQLLFGELVEVLVKKHTNWAKIRCLFDNYIGWIDKRQIHYISEKEMLKYQGNCSLVGEFAQGISSDEETHCVTYGCELQNYDGISSKMPFGKFLYNGQIIHSDKIVNPRETLIKLAYKFLHVPYQWGGRSPFGIDCSGLTQILYKMIGIAIPRDASDQIHMGTAINFVEDARPGDLAFFEKKDGAIHHVGILLGDNKIMHASGLVKIDRIDHFGIFVQSETQYTHTLRICKNIIGDR